MISNSLTKLRNRDRSDDGFTLIELLVVVVILGILIGIAIPVYLNYRKSANDKAAQSDVRNAVSTLEVCNTDGGYPTATGSPATGGDADRRCTQTINVSSGTTLTYMPTTGSPPSRPTSSSAPTAAATATSSTATTRLTGGSVKAVTAADLAGAPAEAGCLLETQRTVRGSATGPTHRRDRPSIRDPRRPVQPASCPHVEPPDAPPRGAT